MHNRTRMIAALGSALAALALGGTAAAHDRALLTPQATRAAATTEHVGALAPGDELFWDGPYFEHAGPENYPITVKYPCGIAVCLDYTIDVVGGGARLRVALDHPAIEYMDLELYDDEGSLVDGDMFSCNCYSREVFAESPATGTWVVRVIASFVTNSAFRMRAKLERPAKPKRKPLVLLPDLRPTAPFQITFDPNARVSDLDGCQLSEIAPPPVGYGATRCLRFSTGPQNIGDAPLDLFVKREDAGRLTGPMYQRFYYSDGRPPEDKPAGEFEWHEIHRHYHHSTVGKLELFRVLDPLGGALAKAGDGPKQGVCMEDMLIARWYEFDQDPSLDVEDIDFAQHCFVGVVGLQAPAGTHMSLARGWGDVYTYGTEGNYVEFRANPDGLYVVRVTTNPEHAMHETGSGNNVAFAYVRIEYPNVEVLERGYGLSPWDRRKAAANDTRPETP